MFGHLVDGFETLDALEKLPVGKKHRPVTEVTIDRVTIHANPFAERHGRGDPVAGRRGGLSGFLCVVIYHPLPERRALVERASRLDGVERLSIVTGFSRHFCVAHRVQAVLKRTQSSRSTYIAPSISYRFDGKRTLSV